MSQRNEEHKVPASSADISETNQPYQQRYVAIGDSFTEGVGDVELNRPNGVRGWADRVAERLCREHPDFGYANLAIRGKKVPQIMEEQFEPALALKPTLATVCMGGNDIMRPRVDIDSIAGGVHHLVSELRGIGAKVVLFTSLDVSKSPLYRALAGRAALYNERLREIADDTGAVIADYWRWRELQDPGYWSADRLHMNSRGHELTARRTLDVLGYEVGGFDVEPIELPELSKLQRARTNAEWVREHAGPWVRRRIKRVSSGDTLSPRYPEYVRIQAPEDQG